MLRNIDGTAVGGEGGDGFPKNRRGVYETDGVASQSGSGKNKNSQKKNWAYQMPDKFYV